MSAPDQRRVPTIYWINLERSSGRRERMQERLSQRGLVHVRVPGVDGEDATATAHALRSRAPTVAEAACLASHLRAVKLAFNRGERHALVLEDDTTFEPFDAWPEGFSAITAALPEPFSACSLCVAETPRALDALFRSESLTVPLGRRGYWSLGATLYHRRGMQALLRAYDRGDHFDITDFRGRHDAYQLIMRTLQHVPGLPGPLVSRVPLFLFEGDDSEIHPEHLGEHRVARDYQRTHYRALIAGSYRSPFGWRARLSRWQARLGARSGDGAGHE